MAEFINLAQILWITSKLGLNLAVKVINLPHMFKQRMSKRYGVYKFG